MLSKESSTPGRCYAASPRTTTQRTPQRIHTPTRSKTFAHAARELFKQPIPPDFSTQQDYYSQSNNQQSDPNFFAYNPEKEPIKAYLRIRPPLRPSDEDNSSCHTPNVSSISTSDDDSVATTIPYLQITDDSEVCMTPPEDSNAYRTRNRAPERYRFTKIFTENVSQQEFFDKTTLPLIKDVLKGENALIFAYGVTNSGKTYSIMGTRQDTGLLPRTLDVLFNSIKDYTSDSKLKPVMHSLVQAYEDKAEENRFILEQAGSTETAHVGSSNCDLWDGHQIPACPDSTVIPIDERYEYGIWVSFAEIYTERIYDLLVAPDKQQKRKSLALKYEFRSGHKYIAGLKEVKVRTIEEAYTILREGQRNRAVFSTLMNRTSSRSHSIFTIRIVRVPIYENEYVIEDPSYAVVSKMSIVDLAGSERYRNTLNSGQRLKEAGNINKSLMVLGQCMETLRLNQLKAAMGKRRAIVPFRHSRLTELFKSSFEGDGKAVMVVNVNPTDTGFDENSHVMKFAAVAKDVATWRRIHPKLEINSLSVASKRRRRKSKEKQMSIDSNRGDTTGSTEDMDICHSTDEDEDDEEEEEEDDDDEAEDPFVDNLIAQWADLRDKWMDAETRCATMESDIRQQVSKEMEIELRKMEEIYMSRMTRENNSTTEDIKKHLDQSCTTDDTEDNLFLKNLYQRQEVLTSELNKMRTRVQDNDITKHALLEKIAELEKNRRNDQSNMERLIKDIQKRDQMIEKLQHQQCMTRPNHEDIMDEDNPFLEKKPSQKECSSSSDHTNQTTTSSATCHSGLSQMQTTSSLDTSELLPASTPTSVSSLSISKPSKTSFDEFLDLRKKLRRSIFKTEECSSDADIIMTKVETFEGVTFDMVKESNMGKLLKLISQHQFKRDTFGLQRRAQVLLRKYIKLSISTFAPPLSVTKHSRSNKRDSLIMVAVDAGKEEDLISDMRDALDVLQDENRKLKSRLKTMEVGQRRLMEAFDKPMNITTPPSTIPIDTTTNIESEMMVDDPIDPEEGCDNDGNEVLFSPVLGTSAMMMEEDLDDNRNQEEKPTKRRRKLRIRQQRQN